MVSKVIWLKVLPFFLSCILNLVFLPFDSFEDQLCISCWQKTLFYNILGAVFICTKDSNSYFNALEWWKAKSILIKCAKCQTFGIWYTKHQKPTLISSSKYQKIWHIATITSQIWDGTDINAKNILAYLIHFSLSSYQISLFVCNTSLSLSLSLSLWNSHRPLAILRDKDRPGSPPITNPLCDEEELQCERHSGRKWKLPSTMVTKAIVLIWLSLLKGNKH